MMNCALNFRVWQHSSRGERLFAKVPIEIKKASRYSAAISSVTAVVGKCINDYLQSRHIFTQILNDILEWS